MDAEFDRLETQIEQLIDLYAGLKSKNRELRLAKAQLEVENRQLADRMRQAIEKLEALLARLSQA
jgi:FtsZ-binding cell division protein ZapB